ncbi:MAG TPA: hypothetical protein VE967_01970 [Gemmatimonadaceae bacterium]|nr:hypothetical protein [Gemmatimonadaceae bacterium]
MDLAFAERLVCPEGHAETPLVVRADEVANGQLLRGVLGCPVCTNEWPVDQGIARFGPPTSLAAAASPDATTAAALLGLTEPSVVVCDGASEELLHALSADYHALIMAMDVSEAGTAVSVVGAKRVPLAHGVARAALLLRPARDPGFVASAMAAVTTGGRVVGAAAMAVPEMVDVLARDANVWVAETRSAPVALLRKPK